MNYFVSINNSLYYHWQIELLIESFKIYDLEKNLYIFLANGQYKDEVPKNCKNLINHKNVFKHEYFGANTNELVALHKCIDEKIIEYPFVFMHPSTILKSPLNKYNKEYDVVLDYNYESNSQLDEFLLNNNINAKFNFSTPIIFNNNKLDKDFFEKLLANLKYIIEKTDLNFYYDIAAWKITMMQYYGKYTIGSNLLTSTLLHHNIDTPFIDYNHGIPNEFNKRFFTYSEPYDVLLNLNISDNCEYLHKVIKSYLKT